MKHLILVRHSPAKLTEVLYGQMNVPVLHSPTEAAAVILASFTEPMIANLRAIYTSPWERTQLVAEQIARELRLPLKIDHRLSELSFGRWEGLPYKQIQHHEKAAYDDWVNHWPTVVAPGGESVHELTSRVSAWIAELPECEETSLVITDANVIRTLLALQPEGKIDCWRMSVPHLELIKIAIEN